MSKREILALLLSVALVTLPLLAGDTTSLQPMTYAVGGNAHQSIADQVWDWIRAETRLTDWLLVAAGIGQLVLIGRQAAIAEGQRELASTQLRLFSTLERPLVLMGGINWNVDGWRDAHDKRSFPPQVLRFTNYGRDVGLIKYCCISRCIGVKPPERREKSGKFLTGVMRREDGGIRHFLMYQNSYLVSNGLCPGEEWEVHINSQTLTPAEMDEISTGHQRVWIDGVAKYNDVAGTSHETHFRLIYDPAADFFLPDESAPEFNRHN